MDARGRGLARSFLGFVGAAGRLISREPADGATFGVVTVSSGSLAQP
jgi:hypothetical protein